MVFDVRFEATLPVYGRLQESKGMVLARTLLIDKLSCDASASIHTSRNDVTPVRVVSGFWF